MDSHGTWHWISGLWCKIAVAPVACIIGGSIKWRLKIKISFPCMWLLSCLSSHDVWIQFSALYVILHFKCHCFDKKKTPPLLMWQFEGNEVSRKCHCYQLRSCRHAENNFVEDHLLWLSSMNLTMLPSFFSWNINPIRSMMSINLCMDIIIKMDIRLNNFLLCNCLFGCSTVAVMSSHVLN